MTIEPQSLPTLCAFMSLLFKIRVHLCPSVVLISFSGHGQSRLVPPGRAWSHPFKKKRLFIFYEPPPKPSSTSARTPLPAYANLRQPLPAHPLPPSFFGGWQSTRTNQAHPRPFKPIQDPPGGYMVVIRNGGRDAVTAVTTLCFTNR